MRRKHPRLRLLCGVLVLALCTSAATQAGAVTQSEIDALKKEQQESQAKQAALKDQQRLLRKKWSGKRRRLGRRSNTTCSASGYG